MKAIHLTLTSLIIALSPASAALAEDGAPNSIGMEFVAIPVGEFLMGSPEAEGAVPAAERPQHKVSITRPLHIGKFEVTQAQWEAVIGSSPFDRDRSNRFYNLPGMAERITKPDHPANVSWNDAQEFMAALNAREGRKRYHLPTEAEWEYAARAGTTTAYSFGDDEADLAKFAWFGGNGCRIGTARTITPLALLQALTAAANVSCAAACWHVTGGGWRSAFRRDYDPDYRGISIGLRLVMESTGFN